MSKEELKPCPFCGGEAKLRGRDSHSYFYIVCFTCRATGEEFKLQCDAITQWNTRAESSELKDAKKRIEELEKEKAELIEWLEIVKLDIEAAFKGKFPFDEVCGDTHSGIEEWLYKLKGGEG